MKSAYDQTNGHMITMLKHKGKKQKSFFSLKSDTELITKFTQLYKHINNDKNYMQETIFLCINMHDA